MPVTDVVAALVRRWYLVLVGLLATAGLAYLTPTVVPVTYEARALMVLLPPRNLENIGGNPYLALGGLDSVVGVLSRSMVTDSTVKDIQEIAPGSTYDVAPDNTISGPVMLIVVEAKTAQQALDAVDSLVDIAPTKVADLQQASDVKSASQITVDLVTQDDSATTLRKSQIRALLVAVVLGLAATVVVVCWLDGFLRRRKERKDAAREPEPTPEPPDPEPDPPDPDPAPPAAAAPRTEAQGKHDRLGAPTGTPAGTARNGRSAPTGTPPTAKPTGDPVTDEPEATASVKPSPKQQSSGPRPSGKSGRNGRNGRNGRR